MADVSVVANIAALRAITGGSAQPEIWVQGFSTLSDGGEGLFAYNATDTTSADNGGTIIVTSNSARYYRQYQKDPINVCWFGAAANHASDSAPAVAAALSVLPPNGGQIFFPAGSYSFNSTITFNMPTASLPFSLTILGAGADATTLSWSQASGFVINMSEPSHSIHFRDMTLVTGQACGYLAIEINQSNAGYPYYQSDFVRLTFRGSSAISEYWEYAIYIAGLNNVFYETLLVYGGSTSGGGIYLAGGPQNQYSVVHNIVGCTFFNVATGILYGGYVQGVTVSQCNFTNSVVGINIPSQVTGGYQLAVASSQFDCSSFGIYTQSSIAAVSVSSCLFFVHYNSSTTTAGINLNGYSTYNTFTGNVFLGSGRPSGSSSPTGTGIIGAAMFYSTVTGNSFSNINIGVDFTGSYKCNCQANTYDASSQTGVVTQVVPGPSGYNSVGVATN